MRKEKALYDQFVNHMGCWGWIHLFYKYDNSCLVIADQPFINLVRAARPASLACNFVTPQLSMAAVHKGIKKILVFCAEGEVSLVSALQQKYPNIIVTSGTYSFTCTGPKRLSRLKNYTPPQKKPNPVPVILLTTPYCDGEFVAKAMANNGLPMPFEYFARPLISWMAIQKDFQIVRYYRRIVEQYSNGEELYLMLQTDFLRAVFENTGLSVARFIQFLEKSGAKVVFLNRKNRFMQAVTGQILHATGERSIWSKPPNKALKRSAFSPNFADTFARYNDLEEDQKLLDRLSNSGVDSLHLVLEDFIDNQER
ncbi:MAG: hypothetical protein COB37_11580, partial [Kordiimonadales bacterium]